MASSLIHPARRLAVPSLGPAILTILAILLALALPTGAAAEFVNGTSAAGFWGSLATWGAQIVDFDEDGDLEVLNAHHFASAYLFTNYGNGTFNVWGLPQPVTGSGDRHGFLWVDLDGDGEVDGVCSHGGEGGSGSSGDPNELWRGTGDGILELVSGAGGMADSVGRGRAFSAADVDGDGDLDLFHGKAPLLASPNSLYRNDGGLAFVDVAPAWGVDEGEGTVGARFVDYDDDGDPDLFVGGEEFARSTLLYRNDGGAFTDVTAAAFGGELPVIAGCDWGDWDGDGDEDLVVVEGQEGVYDVWYADSTDYWWFAHHRLDDDGVDKFEVETPGEDPIGSFRYNGSVLTETIFLGPTGAHPSNATVTLTDAYVGAPTYTPGVDHGVFVWRESVGGKWHFHVSAPPGTYGNFSMKLTSVNGPANPADSNLEQIAVPPAAPRVWRNDGGSFVEMTGLGLTTSANPRHVAWVDFDNDGDLDLHQMNRGTVETGNEADVLWRNDGDSFVPLGGPDWVDGDEAHITDGGVWGDLDRDGDLDLILQEGTGPAFFTIGTPARYYRNEGPAGHWLTVRPGRTLAGGTPVGVKMTAHAGGLAVHRRLDADSWRGFQGPLELHFGLGASATVDSLVVVWPGGGREALGPIAADAVIKLSEGSSPIPVPVIGGPDAALVGRLFPQPARGLQRLRLAPPSPGVVAVRVYDVRGRRVRTLREPSRLDGPVTIGWDGRDDAGRRVAPGVYFLRGEGDFPFERKAIRLR